MKKIIFPSLLFFLFIFIVSGKNKDTVQLGNIKVSVKDKSILIPAKSAIDSGILEYMAVTKSGKTYESVMALQCDAKNFHAALLLINTKPGKIIYPKDSNSNIRVLGDTLLLDVIFAGSNSKTKTIPVLDLIEYRDPLLAKKGNDLKKNLHWIFTGSRTINIDGRGKMVHESVTTGSLIAIFIDEAAEINFSKTSKTPYQGDTFGFKIKTDIIKKIGKNYLLRITKK